MKAVEYFLSQELHISQGRQDRAGAQMTPWKMSKKAPNTRSRTRSAARRTRPQPVQGADDEAVVQAADEVKLASFEQRIAELKDVGVKHLRLATRLLNRKEATVIAATSKRFARYRALQAPIFRIKTDGQKN